VKLADFDPCSILLNNDLSAGAPAILKGLDPTQTMLPPLHAGWATRSKSKHFTAYDEVALGFAGLIGIDPWLINPYHALCGEVDFQAREGEECLADHVAAMLEKIRVKYREHRIDRQPFVIVKADAGTYGMGIMTVKSPDDVRDLNRKQRNKMAVVKEGLSVTQVLVQEGVPTYESLNEAVAEPVVYMIDHFVIGGFYRVHTSRATTKTSTPPHALPAAGLRPERQLLRQRGPPRRADEPLLHLRRPRPPGRPGGGDRAGEDGPRQEVSMNLLFIADRWRPSRPTRTPPTP